MEADWIARGIAAAAALAAIVNSVISYRKLKLDREDSLPKVSWTIDRIEARVIDVTFTLINDQLGAIEAKRFVVIRPPGAIIVKPRPKEDHGIVQSPSRTAQNVPEGRVEPSAKRAFTWRLMIKNEYPAAYPLTLSAQVGVDLGRGERFDHNFKLTRKV